MKKLAILFFELFKISLFIIGGGYAILAVADDTFARKGWIREGELVDHLPVFQTIPGLIATHTAVYIGRKTAGGLGAAVGVFAVALPSVIIFTCVAMGYKALPLDNPWLTSGFVGLRSALTGVILATIIRGWKRNLPDGFAYAVMLLSFAALGFFLSPVWSVLLIAMAMGLAAEFGNRPKEKRFESNWLALLLFLKYGALCFGGGFVLVPMYIQDFVGGSAAFLQIAHEEFSNVIALSQMTPGPIGVNGATFFGYRLCGVPGALLASAALLLPGSLLCYLALSSLEKFKTSRIVRGLMRGIRPGSVALMLVALWAFAGLSLSDSENQIHWWAIVFIAVTTVVIMKKKMNMILLIVLCTLAASALRAGDAVTAERYPDADTVIVDDRTHVVYEADGTYVATEEELEKALTEPGRRSLSAYSLSYSRRYGEAEIVTVEIIDAEGRARPVDFRATLKEATDNESASANIYDPLDKVLHCAVPGIRVGETRRVVTRRKVTKSRVRDQWARADVFEAPDPIVRASLVVDGPAERPIRSVALRRPLGNVTSSVVTNGARIVSTWEVRDSPQMFPEPSMPPWWNEGQGLRLSTASDWREISKWYWEVSAPHLAKTTPEMTNVVESLGRDLRAIFKFVSQEVRYMGLTLEDTSPGYAPHDVDITFGNRYGVCRDKAALLVALLRIAGFEAFPVLINVGAKMDADVPLPYFNHAVVCVDRGGRDYQLMDPTNENTQDLCPAYLSDKSYLVARPEGETLRVSPVPPPEMNAVEAVSRGSLGEDGSVTLDADIGFSGINDAVYRGTLARRTPEERVKFFERTVRAVAAGAELIRCEVEPADMRDTRHPVRVRLTARFPEALLEGATRAELSVPALTKALGCANWILEGETALERRKYPLVLDSTAMVRERVEIDTRGRLGSPLAAEGLPADSVSSPGYGYRRAFSVSNDVLVLEREVSVSSVEFSPEAYLELREALKGAEAAERKTPAFALAADRDADVRTVLSVRETTTTSPRDWRTVETCVREVLTYAGKRAAAEMKFDYNPACETVRLVSATVSNRNGQVHAVAPHEMNVMDADWVSRAPRYPAGKTLVVNLPAVEVGSVISTVVETTVADSPVPFYAVYAFDSAEPLGRKTVTVDGWTRTVEGPKRLAKEPGQPYAQLWRDVETVSKGDWSDVAAKLRPACAVKAAAFGRELADEARRAAGAGKDPLVGVKAVRDWMSRQVRVAGPSLYDVPVARQLTDPDTVVKERYATRLDYVRTLCALLRGAGYRADVVFATTRADDPEELRRRVRDEVRAGAFCEALCRVRIRRGGFLGLGGRTTVYYLGTENEYTPLGTTAYDRCAFFDPATCGFGEVAVADPGFAASETVVDVFSVRENGAVDVDVKAERRGAAVGSFRKRFAEILPEQRSRLHQSLLGEIAQAASATSELVTDVEGYPATMSFSCYVPGFATVSPDGASMSLELPAFKNPVPALVGGPRRTPFAVGGGEDGDEIVRVTFPEGYTEVERLPEPFDFGDPGDPAAPWVAQTCTTRTEDGRLTVEVERRVFRRPYGWYRASSAALVRDWNRAANARSSRTITVRRAAVRAPASTR